MDWTAPVDLYCERLGVGFWAEPVNALTNIAFVAAGIAGAKEASRTGRWDTLTAILCSLAVLIGLGSFLFHTVAQRWAGLADVIPIVLFIVLYLYAAMTRFFGLRWPLAIPVTALAFGAALTLRKGVLILNGGKSLNGSEGYAPAFALLAGSALALLVMRHPARLGIAAAAAVFLVSLVARTVDPVACQGFPLGTHFLWHLLNGAMIGILLITLARHGNGRATERAL